VSKKAKPTYYVSVTIRGNYFPLQQELKQRFGETVGGGYCFFNGERDLEWERKTEFGAEQLQNMIKTVAGRFHKRVRVEIGSSID